MKLVINKGPGSTSTARDSNRTSEQRKREYENDLDESHIGEGGDSEEEEEKSTSSIKKSFTNSFDVIKSLTEQIEHEVSKHSITPLEMDFLITELGYTKKDIQKGIAVIQGRDRHKFTEWLLQKAEEPIFDLIKGL